MLMPGYQLTLPQFLKSAINYNAIFCNECIKYLHKILEANLQIQQPQMNRNLWTMDLLSIWLLLPPWAVKISWIYTFHNVNCYTTVNPLSSNLLGPVSQMPTIYSLGYYTGGHNCVRFIIASFNFLLNVMVPRFGV